MYFSAHEIYTYKRLCYFAIYVCQKGSRHVYGISVRLVTGPATVGVDLIDGKKVRIHEYSKN